MTLGRRKSRTLPYRASGLNKYQKVIYVSLAQQYPHAVRPHLFGWLGRTKNNFESGAYIGTNQHRIGRCMP